MRGTLAVNDPFSYGMAFLVVVLQLLHYSPRILPVLFFDVLIKTGRIPAGISERHEMELLDSEIVFRYGETERRMRYANLVRVNRSRDIVLFYTRQGTVEPVPARAFGYECADVLADIQRRVKAARKDRDAYKRIGPFEGEHLETAEHSLSAEEFLCCNAVHTRYARRYRLKSPTTAFWFAVLLLVLAGSVMGLLNRFVGIVPPMGIVTVYYVAGILACLIGAVILFRPVWFVNWCLKQNLKMQQYPYGFFDSHELQWCKGWVAFRYGLTGSRFPWDAFTDIRHDSETIYFYQNDTLVFFVPKKGLGEKLAMFLKDSDAKQMKG